ncbi:hypothetical protein CMUS01_02780 [Colletotrichum musicola]|uniref:Integral membrane protein n=1 Tax=Colletotrichum musicola TaxID=2175873 RepID=A0A8H6NUD3_9PEZI|nr:hypothetical protein CMUS01_02780 [Colletotrichum musicola]
MLKELKSLAPPVQLPEGLKSPSIGLMNHPSMTSRPFPAPDPGSAAWTQKAAPTWRARDTASPTTSRPGEARPHRANSIWYNNILAAAMDMTNMTGPPPAPGGAGGPGPNPLFPRDTRAPVLLGVASMFIVITVVFVGVRVYIRELLMKRWGHDDSMFVLAATRRTALWELTFGTRHQKT